MEPVIEMFILIFSIIACICLCCIPLIKYRAYLTVSKIKIQMKNRLSMVDIEPVIHENIENYEQKV